MPLWVIGLIVFLGLLAMLSGIIIIVSKAIRKNKTKPGWIILSAGAGLIVAILIIATVFSRK